MLPQFLTILFFFLFKQYPYNINISRYVPLMMDDGYQPLLLPSGKHLGGPKCLSGVSLVGKGSGDPCKSP